MNKKTISIGVLSYNSENTILETLDSIANQSYGSNNIELIIGDDGSQDNSQKIINDWVSKNKNNFFKIILILKTKNKGLVANFNSICQKATSSWIKPIAADDILKNNCLEVFNKFTEQNKYAQCILCQVQKFNSFSILDIVPKNSYYFNLSPSKQFQELLIDNFVPAPGCFLRLDLLAKLNYAEEGMVMEDYPLWLKLTSQGIRLYFIEEVLVKYRISESISNSNTKLINIELNNDVYKCKKKFLPELNSRKFLYILYALDINLFKLTNFVKVRIFNNKKNFISKKLSLIVRLTSPLYLKRKWENKYKSQSKQLKSKDH